MDWYSLIERVSAGVVTGVITGVVLYYTLPGMMAYLAQRDIEIRQYSQPQALEEQYVRAY